MGSNGRAASKKSSRNQGLRPVSAISPAMLGPNNPLQPPAPGYLSQQQPTCEKSKILGNTGLSARQGAAKSGRRPLQPVPARRVITPADRLDDPAQQRRLLVTSQPNEGRPVDGDLARRRDVEGLDRGGGKLLLTG